MSEINKLLKITKLYSTTLASCFVFVVGCTPSGNGILDSKSSISEVIDNTTKQAPFAYDLAADTISYNSCTALSNTQAVSNLKIGVSEGFINTNGNGAVKGGIKLKTEFLQYIGKYFTPAAPSSTIIPAQVLRVLNKSAVNQNARIQFSIRRKNNLNLFVDQIASSMSETYSATPLVGRDATLIAAELNSGYAGELLTKDIKYTTAGTILSEGARNYNLSGTQQSITLHGAFRLNQTEDSSITLPPPPANYTPKEYNFGAAELYSQNVRNKFNATDSSKIIVTALFSTSASGSTDVDKILSIKRPDPKDLTKAYGRGYALQFTAKSSTVAGWTNKNILSGVTEIDLSTGSNVTGSTWTCEHFPIVRDSQYDKIRKDGDPQCTALLATDLPPERQGRQLQIKKIRRHYPESEWKIGLFIPPSTTLASSVASRTAQRDSWGLCVTPKTLSCYLPTGTEFMDNPSLLTAAGKTEFGVQYDPTKECYLTAYNSLGINYSVSTDDQRRMLGRCAQYASICTRTSTNF